MAGINKSNNVTTPHTVRTRGRCKRVKLHDIVNRQACLHPIPCTVTLATVVSLSHCFESGDVHVAKELAKVLHGLGETEEGIRVLQEVVTHQSQCNACYTIAR